MVIGDAKVSDRQKFISVNGGKVMGKWSKRLEDFTPTFTCLTPPERIVKGCQYQLKCECKKGISRYFQLRLIAWMEDSSRDGADEQFVSHKIRSLSSHHPPSSGPRAITFSLYLFM